MRNANHETNALAVANGQVDVAANNTENLARIEKTNPKAFANLKVIWKSPLIPADPIVWNKKLDQATKDKLYTFFMSYGRLGTPEEVAEARKVLSGLAWAPFKPSSDAQLYAIRVMAITKDMFKIEADEKFSAEEKAAKLKELSAGKGQVREADGNRPPGLNLDDAALSPGGGATCAAVSDGSPRGIAYPQAVTYPEVVAYPSAAKDKPRPSRRYRSPLTSNTLRAAPGSP